MPCAAGVGYSHNSYVWSDSIDPDAGMLRIVAGLGTRAVDRTESDYPRIASLDAPRMMPIAGEEDRARFSQKYLDVLDLKKNELVSDPLDTLAPKLPFWLQTMLFEHDTAAETYYASTGVRRNVLFCNCERILSNAEFVRDMRLILRTLQEAYRYPVDIEFTVNFTPEGEYVINLLQCRPLQICGQGAAVGIPDVPEERIFFSLKGNTMRHAPVVQWGASGNVIRNGVFSHCDAQWHAGWSTENLFENCTVISDTKEFGGYGYAFFASAPEDGAHGPNGPRNVIYNCDAYSIGTGVWLGGMNENWIFAYNRFRVKQGSAFFLKTAGFDHILKGNVAILEDKTSPFVLFTTPDCSGVELIGNTLSGGNGKLFEGMHKPLVEKDNRVIPLDPELPRPTPAVPSIYEWQMKHRK